MPIWLRKMYHGIADMYTPSASRASVSSAVWLDPGASVQDVIIVPLKVHEPTSHLMEGVHFVREIQSRPSVCTKLLSLPLFRRAVSLIFGIDFVAERKYVVPDVGILFVP